MGTQPTAYEGLEEVARLAGANTSLRDLQQLSRHPIRGARNDYRDGARNAVTIVRKMFDQYTPEEIKTALDRYLVEHKKD